ncbi:uncharacterized protein PHALS_11813 [Plasmopara halstedii]|uniref:Uncharacterized protein n=1 Tax=Plasmopara halstedii TaxID=4781 RepID=A0A0P1AKT5_PLAHL|nr:uncharacterized protein PHALS_11813 [Plasmopara halstedii]CEG41471.1 hypothetical protein PHALS_11813 [Plasmopara halstedii]|eukprot:XP_024577840.1 hypothetical protein PHALS_11813 [Plasmopara halstedii]
MQDIRQLPQTLVDVLEGQCSLDRFALGGRIKGDPTQRGKRFQTFSNRTQDVLRTKSCSKAISD